MRKLFYILLVLSALAVGIGISDLVTQLSLERRIGRLETELEVAQTSQNTYQENMKVEFLTQAQLNQQMISNLRLLSTGSTIQVFSRKITNQGENHE